MSLRHLRVTSRGIEIPAGRRVAGPVRVPPSKSLTHRVFNLALLARRPLTVEHPLDAEDTRLFRQALERLGWRVEPVGEQAGGGAADGLRLVPGELPAAAAIDCGNAGTMFRFLVASLAVLPGRWILDGTPRLRERPVAALVAALRALGGRIEYVEREGCAPLAITGGRLAGGRVELDAGTSSQFLSALLMAALRAEDVVTVEVAALTSEPYVDLTLDAVAAFGGRIERRARGFRIEPGIPAPPAAFAVEGDWSAACYPAAAAALTGGRVTLLGLARESRQGDRGFLEILTALGAEVAWSTGPGGDELTVRGTGRLRGADVSLASMPDQVPTLAALAPFAHGTTRIREVPHLRVKESDRLAAMAEGLGRLGAEVEERPDGLVIPGVWSTGAPPPPPAPIAVDPHDDHRIAMSLALTGLVRPGVLVTRPETVGKSYAAFWQHLDSVLG
ncbi:MAG TPA: 3-phosphoshikimate 1-carboxyvinyltransferase [Thermoanaerobaculia bacterium]|nr:3-phosphoshikimate 1-carboxyvinyltransferase [Thermoanaerobaculia bacterium]